MAYKFYRQHRYPMRAEQLRHTVRHFFLFSFLMVNFKVISNFNPLEGLIMEKIEKYMYILPLTRHIGCRICKIKFAHHFAKCKLEIGGKCTRTMRVMGVMGAPMSGRLKEGEMAPVLESSRAPRKVKNAVFWP